jgi:hypothetical protein
MPLGLDLSVPPSSGVASGRDTSGCSGEGCSLSHVQLPGQDVDRDIVERRGGQGLARIW